MLLAVKRFRASYRD